MVRWRLVDLAGKIERQFGVRLAERSVGSLLRRLGFRRLSVRPHHPHKDIAAQEAFKKTCRSGCRLRSAARTRQADRDLVAGRSHVGQQGTLTRVWAERGSRPPAPRDQRYDWAYLFGAVCPARGTGAGSVLPEANTEAMNLHLTEIERHIMPDSHAVVVLDRAGWHQLGGRLNVPQNISLLPLILAAAETVGEDTHRHAHERTQQRRQRDQQTDRRVVEVEVGLYLMREGRDRAPRGERHRECGGCQREIDVRLSRVDGCGLRASSSAQQNAASIERITKPNA